MVRTFPETRFIIVGIYRTICMYAPVPFTIPVVYQILLDEFPATESFL
jgi:hypothetical protein